MPDAFAFKGNLPFITVLKIYDANIDAINVALREKKRGAPLMLVGMQVIVDVTECSSTDINVSEIKRSLMDEGVMPIAVMSHDFTLMAACADAQLGFIPPFKRESEPSSHSQQRDTSQSNTLAPDNSVHRADSNKAADNPHIDAQKAVQETAQEPSERAPTDVSADESNVRENATIDPSLVENMVVTRQIRSGQRIYAKGDLTVVGSVGAGAEVIADGNIHIYGALRGRALAGAKGDETAAIFCQNFAAELVSIAGFYVGAVDTDPQYNQAAVQISLNDEKIKFYRL